MPPIGNIGENLSEHVNVLLLLNCFHCYFTNNNHSLISCNYQFINHLLN